MSKTKIEWADKTWNPITGCTKISPGCQNCYAERMAKRLQAMGMSGYKGGFSITNQADHIFIQPMKWRKPSRIFVCSMGDLFHEDVNVRWIDGVFGSMGLTYDCTGEMVRNESGGASAIQKQRHTYLILTKRPERMKEYILELINADWEALRRRFYHFAMAACNIRHKAAYLNHMNASMSVASWIKSGMPGLWLGVTAENQDQADKRIPLLLQIPADKRFVSVEPMLGPVNIRGYLMQGKYPGKCSCGHGHGFTRCPNYGGIAKECHHKDCNCKGFERQDFAIDHVICGGESGPGARPMHPSWVRGLRDQCKSAGVPFLFKQWGEWASDMTEYPIDGPKLNPEKVHWIWPDGSHKQVGCGETSPGKILTYRVGKKSGGRTLDGQLWNQYPVEAITDE